LFQRAAERVARLGWHVQTYTNLGILAPLTDLIFKLPRCWWSIISDGQRLAQGVTQPGFAESWRLLRSGRVYVKISAPYRHLAIADYADGRARAHYIAVNPTAFVGTDWPHPAPQARSPDDRAVPARRRRRGAQSAWRAGPSGGVAEDSGRQPGTALSVLDQ